MSFDDRQTGKTTRLIERAVQLLSELPEDERVYVTGAHTRWLHELELRFKEAGLTDVQFITVPGVLRGALRGRRGRLLIDDPNDIPYREWQVVYEEYLRLERLAPNSSTPYT